MERRSRSQALDRAPTGAKGGTTIACRTTVHLNYPAFLTLWTRPVPGMKLWNQPRGLRIKEDIGASVSASAAGIGLTVFYPLQQPELMAGFGQRVYR
jgi:hypothetical protein